MTRYPLRNLVFFLFFVVATASSQQFASLGVTVTDPSGSVVPGAVVSISSETTGISRVQSTDLSGSVIVPALTAGNYTLAVHAKDFSA
jgi:hypothetical protein